MCFHARENGHMDKMAAQRRLTDYSIMHPHRHSTRFVHTKSFKLIYHLQAFHSL